MKTIKSAWWLSDCGKYVAHIWGSMGNLQIDVMSTTGEDCWLGGRYTPSGWHDRDKRYIYPEFAHMVTSWSSGGPQAFSVGFADLDQSIRIVPLKGNAVRKAYTARFSRPMTLRTRPKINAVL